MLWDLILEAFWVPLGSFLWFWGVLGMGWNFDVFWDLPWGGPGSENKVRLGLKAASWGTVNSQSKAGWVNRLVTGSQHQLADQQIGD